MIRTKVAQIALCIVVLVNVVLLLAPWQIPRKPIEIVMMFVCGGIIVLAYREEPASFHRQVSRSEALWTILVPVIAVLVVIVLGRNN
jgi:hypothetical protein